MLNLEQSEVAGRAGIARATLISYEKSQRIPRPSTIAAIRSTLEAAGIDFLGENGGGAGVRLKK